MLEGEKYVKSGEWYVGWYQVRRGCCRADAPQWRRGYPEREETGRKIPWIAYSRQRNPLYGNLVQSNILCNKKKKITLWWAYCITFTFYKDALKDFFAFCKHGAIRNEHLFSDTAQAHAEKWPVVNCHWQNVINRAQAETRVGCPLTKRKRRASRWAKAFGLGAGVCIRKIKTVKNDAGDSPMRLMPILPIMNRIYCGVWMSSSSLLGVGTGNENKKLGNE